MHGNYKKVGYTWMLDTHEREVQTIGRDAESPVANSNVRVGQLAAFVLVQKHLKQSVRVIAFPVPNNNRFCRAHCTSVPDGDTCVQDLPPAAR